MLKASAIPGPVAAERGYESLADDDAGRARLRAHGFPPGQTVPLPGLLIPTWLLDGTKARHAAIRLDTPLVATNETTGRSTSRRYLYPAGSMNRLDCPPRCVPGIHDPGRPIWFVEGQKKADALAALGVCVVAVLGVWNWLSRPPGSPKGTKGVPVSDFNAIPLKGRACAVVFDSDMTVKRGVEQAMVALADELITRGAASVSTAHLPAAADGRKQGADDYIAAGGSPDDIRATCWDYRWHKAALEPLPLSDLYAARQFLRDHGGNVRYCKDWGTWLTWTGTHWAIDRTSVAMRWAKQTIIRMVHAAGDDVQAIQAQLTARAVREHDDDGEHTRLRRAKKAADRRFAHAAKSLNHSHLDALLRSAQSEQGIPVQPGDVDQHLWHLNCANGILDLRTGALAPHDRAALHTKCVHAAYDPAACCPTWDAFLAHVLGGDTALIGYVQRLIGLTLVGAVRERIFIVLWGSGRNGKSTFLETMHGLLGTERAGYSARVNTRALLVQRFEGRATPEIAKLRGVRFAYANEGKKGAQLNEALIKDMTGGDSITAAHLYGEEFTFKPEFTLWFATNHKPSIRDTTTSIWDRVRLIPFTVTIPEDAQDKTLGDKLEAEAPGILAWAVRGCLAWQQHGLPTPAAVTEATATYRTEQDRLARFLDDVCLMGRGMQTKASVLYATYRRWCEDEGEQGVESQNAFGLLMSEKGFTRNRTTHGYHYANIGLIDRDT
jgi:P4 family phage/plasmid primase-like protien